MVEVRHPGMRAEICVRVQVSPPASIERNSLDKIRLNGVIIDVLPGDKFLVKLENDTVITGYISGRLRKNKIRLLLGDPVDIEVSVYDFSNGRIVYRH